MWLCWKYFVRRHSAVQNEWLKSWLKRRLPLRWACHACEGKKILSRYCKKEKETGISLSRGFVTQKVLKIFFNYQPHQSDLDFFSLLSWRWLFSPSLARLIVLEDEPVGITGTVLFSICGLAGLHGWGLSRTTNSFICFKVTPKRPADKERIWKDLF